MRKQQRRRCCIPANLPSESALTINNSVPRQQGLCTVAQQVDVLTALTSQGCSVKWGRKSVSLSRKILLTTGSYLGQLRGHMAGFRVLDSKSRDQVQRIPLGTSALKSPRYSWSRSHTDFRAADTAEGLRTLMSKRSDCFGRMPRAMLTATDQKRPTEAWESSYQLSAKER